MVCELIDNFGMDPSAETEVSFCENVFKLSNQNGYAPIHLCAQYGYDTLLDTLCEKYGVDPKLSIPVCSLLHIHAALHF